MGKVKFSVWNMEWMNELFEGDPPRFRADDDKGYRTKHLIKARREDLTGIVNHIDSDIWVIVEGPNQVDELQLFFDNPAVNGDWKCAVQPSGAQSLGIAVRTDRASFADVPLTWYDVKTNDEAKSLRLATNEFQMDTDSDGLDEVHKFERTPIYATVHLKDGKEFRVLGLHLKSKGVFGNALEWSKWWSRADGNRKKIVAQCFQLRQHFLNKYLQDNATKDIPLIVCGDINDGPGFDTSEMRLQSSGIESLMGSVWHPSLCLGNAVFDALDAENREELDFRSLSTTSFRDPIFTGKYRKVWIDHILYSRTDTEWITEGTISKSLLGDDDVKPVPYYKAFPTASDHYPVSCIIDSDAL